MGETTGIQWTDATWNPVTGCTKVSQGCKNCYAKYQAWPRLKAARGTVYFGREFENVQCHPSRLDWPYRSGKPMRIFVNSMSDLFHEDVPFEFIAKVFWIMSVTTRHTYQVLTKRPARMLEFFEWADEGQWPGGEQRIHEHGNNIDVKWTPWREGGRHGGYDNCGPAFPYENVWLGVSVEDQATADERIPLLLRAPAAIRFISVEPLISRVDLCETLGMWWNQTMRCFESTGPRFNRNPNNDAQRAIDWVIVGGESGPHARPLNIEWVWSIVRQCQAAGVPVMVKQLGQHVDFVGGSGAGEHWPEGTRMEDTGRGSWRITLRDAKGGDPAEWPEDLRVREFPA